MSSLFGGNNSATGNLSAANKPSNLFGGNANNPTASSAPSGTSLFGGALGGGTTQQQSQPATSSTSLFANLGQNKAAEQKSSLFGNLGTNNQNQPQNTGASSLFGNKPATTQSTGGGLSLFGNTAPTSQAQAGASSLFGGGATATQGQQNTGGSLFGASQPTSQAQQNTSLFGGPNQSSGSIISQEPQPFQRTNDPNAIFGPRQSIPGEPGAQPAYFDSLLEKGRKRQQEENLTPFGELPQLQLGLADISRKVRKIGQAGPSAALARGGDARAHYLLSASGVNAAQALRDLEDLAGKPGSVPSDLWRPIYSSEVKEDLAKKYQDDFQDLVENQRRRVQEDFDRMIDEQLHDVDWNAHRQRIYEHFGLRKPVDTADGAASVKFGKSSTRRTKGIRPGGSTNGSQFDTSGLARSVIGSVGPRGARQSQFADVSERLPSDGLRPAPEDRVLRMKQDRYSEKVQELNTIRLQQRLYPLLHRFAEVEGEPTNEDTSMLVQAYNALVHIVGEHQQEAAHSDPDVVKPRQYAQDYLDDNDRSVGQLVVRRRIVNGSRKYLEQHFLDQAEITVAKNPREANVGGVPTTIHKIKGFVRVKAARKELGPDLDLLQVINGDYCWVVLYYLFRCGLYNEALEYVEQNAAAFKQIDRSFYNYLRHYVSISERRLPSELQTRINNEYSQRQRLAPEDSIDPFRMMCYKVVGRCDLQRRNYPDSIASATDHNDWLWLQFTLAREYDRVEELQQNAFDLRDVSRAVKEIGERHFGPGSDLVHAPMLYFFMQILAGQFESAIANLYPHHYVSAVHFAIALDYYGLLRVSNFENSDDLLSYTTTELPQLSFGSMIGLYTRDFRTAKPAAAVDYLCLICLNADLPDDVGKRQRELCHQALTELVLETRDYAQLLGDIRPDGRRINGVVQQRTKLIGITAERDFLKHITLVAARIAEEQARTSDAALLFHLADDYVRVLQVINEAMSLFLTTELGEQPARLEPLKPRAQPEANATASRSDYSLSLSAIDDPFQLARAFRELYRSHAMYFEKLGNDPSADTCNVLLRLADARQALEQGKWANAVDHIHISHILPTDTNGNMSAIRQKVRDFEAMPPVLARTIGHIMLWTVVACSHEVARLGEGEFDTAQRQQLVANLVVIAKDIMMFAGMIKFKLPARVMDMIARAGQELGVY